MTGFLLPTVDIRLPFLTIIQMPAKDIERARRGLFWNVQQFHMDFFYLASALAMVAVWAGSHNVCPNVLSAQMPWGHVIHSQVALPLSTVLASIIVTAKHLTASQFDVWTRTMNLVLQPDH